MRKSIVRMMMTVTCAAGALLGGTQAMPAHGQALRARIDAAPPGAVEFSYAAVPGVCGDGRAWTRSDGNAAGVTVYGGGLTGGALSERCEAGPVRVRVERDGAVIVVVRTTVGPRVETWPATDLGAVGAQLAADFLLDLAGRSEGRIGRDAILAATLADSAAIAPALLQLARNRALARETRAAALSHLPRAAATHPAGVADGLLAMAHDEEDNVQVRRQALTALARLEDGAGVAALIRLTDAARNAWVAKESMTALAASGDPRARAHLRAMATRTDTGEELRAIAIRGLGQRFASAQDATLLRTIYPQLTGTAARDAVVSALADIGGADNVRWLLARAADGSEAVARRRRAIEHAARAGAGIGELAALYDVVGEQQLKDALVTVLGRSGERAALDKLIDIARTETNVNVRRRAISTLSASDDPRARAVLLELIERS